MQWGEWLPRLFTFTSPANRPLISESSSDLREADSSNGSRRSSPSNPRELTEPNGELATPDLELPSSIVSNEAVSDVGEADNSTDSSNPSGTSPGSSQEQVEPSEALTTPETDSPSPAVSGSGVSVSSFHSEPYAWSLPSYNPFNQPHRDEFTILTPTVASSESASPISSDRLDNSSHSSILQQSLEFGNPGISLNEQQFFDSLEDPNKASRTVAPTPLQFLATVLHCIYGMHH